MFCKKFADMLIYNVTYSVDLDVEEAFLKWMHEKYIPQSVASRQLRNPRLALIMTVEEQEKHHSYSIQYEVDSLDVLEEWSLKDGNRVIGEFVQRFGNKAPGFPTIMEKIEI